MNPTRHVPIIQQPKVQCGICLYRIGFGYDRIAKRLRVTKKNAHEWIRRRFSKEQRQEHSRLFKKASFIGPRLPGYIRKRPKKATTEIELKKRLRNNLWSFFKHGLYPRKMPRLIGCSRLNFHAWISSQFKPGMSMENYGRWHLDHVVPCSKFNLLNNHEAMQCFHWSNLRPEWRRKNIEKSDRIVAHQGILKFHLQ